MANQEITPAEFKELNSLIAALETLIDEFKEISIEDFKVLDSNGDPLGRMTFDYGDVRLVVGELNE